MGTTVSEIGAVLSKSAAAGNVQIGCNLTSVLFIQMEAGGFNDCDCGAAPG